MIVADTNTIAYLLIAGERTLQARKVLKRDPEWAAPLLWRSEFRNVLALLLRKRLLSLRDAQRLMDEATSLMRNGEYEVASSHVLDLVAKSACTAYDCEFVALAQDLEVPLVTVDRQIVTQFPDTAISLDAFLASSEH